MNQEILDLLEAEYARSKWPQDIPTYRTKYPCYVNIFQRLKPKSVLEIGVLQGISTVAMCLGHQPEIIHLVDNQQEGISLVETTEYLRRMFPAVKFMPHVADTQKGPVNIGRERFDFVHIDGNHYYEACTNDLANFGYMADKAILVDDIRDPNVQKATLEYVDKTNRYMVEYIHHLSGGYLLTPKDF